MGWKGDVKSRVNGQKDGVGAYRKTECGACSRSVVVRRA